jgi:GTPase SAR1 family protein
MTSKTSIQDAEEIIQMAQSHKEHELQIPGLPFAPCVLVGCKCDLKDQIENKTTMEAKEMAKKQFFLIGTPDETKLKQMPYFFETSAKENINIQEVYDSVIAQYAERLKYSTKILAKKPKKGLFTSVSHTTKEEVEEDLGALDL